MSFDVFLQRFGKGESAHIDRAPVLAVVRSVQHQGPDAHGFYVVSFADGTDVEFSASGLESTGPFKSCAFHIRGVSESVGNFIFAIARAGDLVILPAMVPVSIALVSESQRSTLPDDLRREYPAVVLDSGADLYALLANGFETWSEFRDQVSQQIQDSRDS